MIPIRRDRSAVVMFCGPHRSNEWSPLYHRIDHAVAVSRETGVPLVVAGDAWDGRALAHFVERARMADAGPVYEAYDPGGYTESDARAVLRLLRDHPDFVAVDRLLVVSDDWHVARCMVMLWGEARTILPRRALVLCDRSTTAGPRPPADRIDDEARGIQDYLAGRPRRPRGTPFGKPFVTADSVASAATELSDPC